MTQDVVEQVDCIARQENMSRGLKILTHNSTTPYNSTLFAEVNEDNITKDHFQGDKSSQNSKENSQSEQTKNEKEEEEEEEYKNQDKMDPDDIVELSQAEELNQMEEKQIPKKLITNQTNQKKTFKTKAPNFRNQIQKKI